MYLFWFLLVLAVEKTSAGCYPVYSSSEIPNHRKNLDFEEAPVKHLYEEDGDFSHWEIPRLTTKCKEMIPQIDSCSRHLRKLRYEKTKKYLKTNVCVEMFHVCFELPLWRIEEALQLNTPYDY
ncbi:unnamed protein product [Caenorhabditis auriculariae]|uniref:Secreted protein n=1 Tax=Caenorhabditis auriculariae TaxID=2777116 RepID=A0A8S1HTB3_9PELO|nr:unnamed protein product [Caenorhabditis auriculariae]